MAHDINHIRKAVKHVKTVAYGIAAVGAVTSFGTQVDLLKHWGMPTQFAWGVAATVDMLAVCAVIALSITGLPRADRKVIGFILFVALSASLGANVTAGLMESVGAAIGHAWPVIAYMGAELIASRIRNYLATVEHAHKEANTPAAPAPVVAPIAASVATVVPTVAAVAPRVAKVAVAKAYNAGVRVGSHASCSHPSTASDRAKCRKAAAIVTP
jgi:hypothetical protein